MREELGRAWFILEADKSRIENPSMLEVAPRVCLVSIIYPPLLPSEMNKTLSDSFAS